MKQALVRQICNQLEAQLERLMHAARESQQASNLAAGQAKHVKTLGEALRMFQRLSLPDYQATGVAGPGALIELRVKDGIQWFLLVPAAGGLEVKDGRRVITLLSPESPLYQEFLGCSVGALFDRPAGRVSSIQ